ncbi:MAG TPA: PQQ-binding-like beta-propeller repeat protein [Bryobacteraceae bacterium]|nr:PQQ-binding-like beta-propeller repeat protein [Bryobacteraceae bacterium]
MSAAVSGPTDWPAYGGTAEVQRYSPLKQIHRGNVRELKVAWTFEFDDFFQNSQIQAQPVMVDGTLYAISPRSRLAALDPGTGKLKWKFDPISDPSARGGTRTRGVMYWKDAKEARVYTVYQQWLYALNAATGKPVKSFGDGGRIDLRQGLDRPPETLSVSLSTPGVVYKDLLIVGSIVAEDLPSAPGHIRAFDARTGEMRWIFRTIPHPGEYGYETWPKEAWKHSGGANDWSGMALDEKRGLVFVPTGSAAFDFYASDRQGDNLFANCLIALDAGTGKRRWHYQFVKHDVWDRDLPAAPSLVTIQRNGAKIDAVAQPTKSGHVWVFDRESGKSLFPIQELKAPASDVDGELLAPTQPLPVKPPAFSRQELTEDLLTRRTPEAHKAVLERFRKLKNGPQFTPPGFEGTIFAPGLDGGATWGGAAFDAETSTLYVNANEMPWILQLGPRRASGRTTNSAGLYKAQCAACHGLEMKGAPPDLPPLTGIASRRSQAEIRNVIRKGVGRMPAFTALTEEALDALVQFISVGENRELISPSKAVGPQLKYGATVNAKFLDPDGYPAIAPPWGTLNAIDLAKGEIRWQVPLGEVPELVEKGLKNTGTLNFGGPVVTAGGLIFIGATTYDEKFRAFDKSTGKLLWETKLPAGNFSTPAVYQFNGKQYVVVPAGGGRGKPSKGTYIAFALP